MATNERAILNLSVIGKDDAARLEELVNSESRNDPETLAIIRRYPDAAAAGGELSRHVAEIIVERLANGVDTVEAECYRQRCAVMRRDLGYDVAPAVERLIIDRIVVTWLHLQSVESARQVAHMSNLSLPKATYYNRAASMAQTDHVRALSALAKLRRLALPTVQVNMTTGNQLNVAG